MRPRLELLVPLSRDRVRELLREATEAEGAVCNGLIATDEVELMGQDAHIWSPQLALRLVGVEQEQTFIKGQYGPHPHLWGLILALYAVCVFSAIGGLVMAWSQSLVEQSPTGLWALTLSGLFAAAAYGSSFVGQRLAEKEMQSLWDFLEESLDVDVVELRVPDDDRHL
jgi:hypothetical protein